MRAENGQAYYYVTDLFLLEVKIEENSPRDSVRYMIGNYFLTKERAELFIKNIRSKALYYDGKEINKHIKGVCYHLKSIAKIIKSWFI